MISYKSAGSRYYGGRSLSLGVVAPFFLQLVVFPPPPPRLGSAVFPPRIIRPAGA